MTIPTELHKFLLNSVCGLKEDSDLYKFLITQFKNEQTDEMVMAALLIGLQGSAASRNAQQGLNQIAQILREQNNMIKQDQIARLQARRLKLDGDNSLFSNAYSVCSQNEEDSIIDAIFLRLGLVCKTAWEFGVGAGLQNNTARQLLSGCTCFWHEINKTKYEFIKSHFSGLIRSGQLFVTDVAVTPENINEVAEKFGIPESLDLLSVDVDGDDYYIVEALEFVKPKVLVCEYNALFPASVSWIGARCDYSGYSAESYVGCSLLALSEMLTMKGYKIVATNLCGLNAFFVRSDLCGNFVREGDVAHHYHTPLHHLGFGDVWHSGPRPNFFKTMASGWS